MSQHFLLSSKARSLSIIDIVKMSDMEAFEMFKAISTSKILIVASIVFKSL